MTIDRQSVVYFINEKGGLALAAEVIHLTYMYTSGGWRGGWRRQLVVRLYAAEG